MVLSMTPSYQMTQRSAWEHVSPRLWAERNVKTERGLPMTYENRPWMRQMLDDPHPRQRWKKCAQVYATTGITAKVLHHVAVLGQVFIYTFPGGIDGGFVSARLNPMIDSSPELQRLARRNPRRRGSSTPLDNMGLKRLGNGLLYIRGTTGTAGAVSTPADGLVHDEIDLCDPKIIGLFRHRLDNVDPPEKKQIYELSNPTVEGFGIDKLYNESDAREWMVRCQHCSWWGPLDYWQHTEGHLLQ